MWVQVSVHGSSHRVYNCVGWGGGGECVCVLTGEFCYLYSKVLYLSETVYVYFCVCPYVCFNYTTIVIVGCVYTLLLHHAMTGVVGMMSIDHLQTV
jgi:hypothetical protein